MLVVAGRSDVACAGHISKLVTPSDIVATIEGFRFNYAPTKHHSIMYATRYLIYSYTAVDGC